MKKKLHTIACTASRVSLWYQEYLYFLDDVCVWCGVLVW